MKMAFFMSKLNDNKCSFRNIIHLFIALKFIQSNFLLQLNLLASGAGDSEIFIWDLNNPSNPMTPGSKIQVLIHYLINFSTDELIKWPRNSTGLMPL